MSWAGKKSFKECFKSLFLSGEQALSSPFVLTGARKEKVEKLLQAWVEGKGYRLPHHTVEEAAQRIGVPYLHLYHYFKAQGTDFRSWRTRLRIEDAMAQIREDPRTPLSVVARRVGIPDRSNFARQFKACTGFTPDEWRQAQNKKS